MDINIALRVSEMGIKIAVGVKSARQWTSGHGFRHLKSDMLHFDSRISPTNVEDARISPRDIGSTSDFLNV